MVKKKKHLQHIARELAKAVLEKYRKACPPSSLFPLKLPKIYKVIGLNQQSRRVNNLHCSGAIIPIGSSMQILVSSKDPQARIRFTIAHEIGHYLLRQKQEKRRASIIHLNLAHVGEEALCNAFASELLMPEEEFKKKFIKLCAKEKQDSKLIDPREFEFGLPQLDELCKSFGVSAEACIRRIHTLNLFQNTQLIAFVGMRQANIYSGENVKFRLRAIAFPQGDLFIPTNMGFDRLGVRESVLLGLGASHLTEEMIERFHVWARDPNAKRYREALIECTGGYRIQGKKNVTAIGVFAIHKKRFTKWRKCFRKQKGKP